MRSTIDRERAAYDHLMTTRDRASVVWFPAVGIAPPRDSAPLAWQAVVVLASILLAGLASLFVPQPAHALRTLSEVEQAIGRRWWG